MITEFVCSDGSRLHLQAWQPAEHRAIGVLLIVHGMGEYGARFTPFAGFMSERGFIVYAPDLRGHGLTAEMNRMPAGHFTDQRGWQTVLDDLHRLMERINEAHPALPLFVFGHSMGSLLVRAYTQTYKAPIQGAIHSAVSGPMGLMAKLGYRISLAEIRFIGLRGYSTRMSSLLTGNFNRRIPDRATPYDWLSRDPSEVERYIRDERIVKAFTAAFYRDMIGGAVALNSLENMRKHPVDLPMLFVSGSADPLGNYGRGAVQTRDRYKQLGALDVELLLYNDARHELFQEVNRHEVMHDIWTWIEKQLTRINN